MCEMKTDISRKHRQLISEHIYSSTVCCLHPQIFGEVLWAEALDYVSNRKWGHQSIIRLWFPVTVQYVFFCLSLTVHKLTAFFRRQEAHKIRSNVTLWQCDHSFLSVFYIHFMSVTPFGSKNLFFRSSTMADNRFRPLEGRQTWATTTPLVEDYRPVLVRSTDPHPRAKGRKINFFLLDWRARTWQARSHAVIGDAAEVCAG